MTDSKQIKDAGDVAHKAAAQGCQVHPQKGFAFTDLDTGIQFSGTAASCSTSEASRNENIDLALQTAVNSCGGIPKQTGVASVGDPAVQVSVPCGVVTHMAGR